MGSKISIPFLYSIPMVESCQNAPRSNELHSKTPKKFPWFRSKVEFMTSAQLGYCMEKFHARYDMNEAKKRKPHKKPLCETATINVVEHIYYNCFRYSHNIQKDIRHVRA